MQSPSISNLSVDQLQQLQKEINDQLKRTGQTQNKEPVLISSDNSASGSSSTDEEENDVETVISQAKEKPVIDDREKVIDSEGNDDAECLTDHDEYYQRPAHMNTGDKHSEDEKSGEEEESLEKEAVSLEEEKNSDKEEDKRSDEEVENSGEEKSSNEEDEGSETKHHLEDEKVSRDLQDDTSIDSDYYEQSSDIQHIGKITPSWYSDPDQGILLRRMRIKALLPPQKQKEMVRRLRKIVRTNCGYSMDEPWSSYGRIIQNKMISSR
jgi:hypothetical protein